MKVYSFLAGASPRAGVEVAGQILDVAAAYEVYLHQKGPRPGWPPRLPASMLSVLRGGVLAREMLQELSAWAARRPAVPVGTRLHYLFGEVTLLPPVSAPGKILCLDCDQGGRGVGACIRNARGKFASSLSASFEPTLLDSQSRELRAVPRIGVVVGAARGAGHMQAVPGSVFGFQVVIDCQAVPVPGEEAQSFLHENSPGFTPVSAALFCLPVDFPVVKLRWLLESPGEEPTQGEVTFGMDWVEAVLSEAGSNLGLAIGDLVAVQSSLNPPLRLCPGSKLVCESPGYATVTVEMKRPAPAA
jgi:hypothetical protein